LMTGALADFQKVALVAGATCILGAHGSAQSA
jgi:hypothetical protein